MSIFQFQPSDLDFYRLAMQGTGDGLWVRDLSDNNSMWLSPEWKEMLGFSEDELPNSRDTWKNRVHKEDIDRVEQAVANCLRKTENAYECEYRMYTKSVSVIWIRARGRVVSHHKSKYFVGVHTNITDLKARELFASSAFDEVSQTIIFAKDKSKTFTYINDYGAELLGLPASQIVGKKDVEVLPNPSEARPFNEDDERVLSGESIRAGFVGKKTIYSLLNINHEVLTDINGVVHLLATIKMPVKGPDGSVNLLGISRDITRDPSGRKTLRSFIAEQELVEMIFEHVVDGIYIKNKRSEFVWCNNAQALCFGKKSPSEVIGKTDKDFFPPEVAAELLREEEQLFSKGGQVRNERRSLKTNDGLRWRLINKIVVPNENPTHLIGVSRDYTKEVELEAHQQREEKHKFQEAIARSIGHCLENWLRVIHGNILYLSKICPLIAKDEEFSRLKTAVGFLTDATNTVTNLNAIRDLTPQDMQEVNLVDELRAVLATVNNSRVKLAASDDSVICRCASIHISNAILELVSNAIRYSPDDTSIKVICSVTANSFIVHVKDNGPGVPDNIKASLFELFTTGAASRTGMGLAYVREVAKWHGGNVTLNKASSGAHFEFSIPRGKLNGRP